MDTKITKDFIYRFIQSHTLAVVSSVTKQNKPESALVGIAVSENLEIIFDTVKDSRKYQNILQNRHVSVVIGWKDETTVQYEGEATETESKELKEIYFNVFSRGREREKWPNIVYFRIQPKWVRYSDFNEPPTFSEMTF